MADPSDPALAALLRPFDEHLLERGPALFLRARPHPDLRLWRGLQATQPSRPAADALRGVGVEVIDEAAAAGTFPLVLLLPPRQRDEARALMAQGLHHVAPGGRLVVAAPNDAGAKAVEADLRALCGPVSVLSKHKCRVAWTAPLDDPRALPLQAPWAGLDAVRSVVSADVPGGSFLTRPGVFAWDRVDAASRLLAAHLPADLSGRAADLGAGWGYLSMSLLARCPGIAALDVFEADARALDLARANLAGARVPVGFHWHDVAAGVDGAFDVIACNPPFHGLERGERLDLGRAFIASAARALAPRGQLWMVANRHLPYEQALADAFARADTVAQQGGFKVVRAERSR